MNEQQGDPESARALAVAGELHALMRKLIRRLRGETHLGDFSWSQRSVLSRLEKEGPTTVTILARAEGMRPQSMSAIVSVLETAGFVSGAPDPTDGRQTILSLTPAYRETIKADRAAREDWLFHAIQTKLSLGEQEELANAIELLKRLADS